jgi:exosome complex component RRP40
MIIGIIRDTHAENYKVDIGGAHYANLSTLGFEGATKKNRPNLHVGDLIYARVVLANKDMEPELQCISARNKAEVFISRNYLFDLILSGIWRTTQWIYV